MCKNSYNCGCGCANKFDCVKICDKLTVKGDTVLKAVEAKSLCFADNGLDGKKWCMSENSSTNALDFFYDGVKKVSLNKEGDVSVSRNVEVEGIIAESTETLTFPTLSNPSVYVTTTFMKNANAVSVTLPNGIWDGQIKRIIPVEINDLFTVSYNSGSLLSNNGLGVVFQWSAVEGKWIVYSLV